MKKAGQIALIKFPNTNLEEGKLRPVLLLSKLPGDYADWLVCMISTREKHSSKNLDEVIISSDTDFKQSGLKFDSVIRIFRLAVVDEKILIGKLGEISNGRLEKIKAKLSDWVKS